MKHPRHCNGTAVLAVAAVAMINAICLSAAPIVVKPLSANNSSPAAAQTLVSYIVGSGVTVVPGSIQYSGAGSASGIFVNGGTDPNTTIGINSGIVLTTGDARAVSGSAAFDGDLPNKNVGFTSGLGNALTRNTAPGNPLFASVTTASTFNASVITFQFVPTGSSVTLNYIYGSEDYNSGVNSSLPNDVMVIMVNGVNYGVVPGTQTPVSASSINCGGPTSGPASGINAQNCALFRDNAPFIGKIETELNGLTTTLEMTAPVFAGQVNTIQIGIANTFDTFFDSALFIQQGSLRSAP
jgi:hypothetical protein